CAGLWKVQLDGEDADVARAHAERRLGRRRGRRLVERRPLDGTGLVRLEEVAFLDVGGAGEQGPALETLRDLTSVVLEALQLGDGRVLDDGAVAHDTHLC